MLDTKEHPTSRNEKNWQNSQGIEYSILAVITIAAALLRFYKLGAWSYWIDEYYSLESSLRPYLQNLSKPFWLITKTSIDIFGVSAISLRLPPFVFGVLAIVALYFPFKAVFGRRVALLSAFFMAISPWHIYLSQLARWYTLLLLVSTAALLSFYFFIERNSFKYLILSIVMFLFAFMLHLTAGFIVLIGVTYLFFLSRIKKMQPEKFDTKKINILFIVLILGAIVLMPKFLEFVKVWNEIQLRDGYWGTTPVNFASKVLYHLTPTMGFASVLGLILLLFSGGRKGLFISIFGVLPGALLILAALLKTNISTKYIFFTLPALLLGASFLCVYVIDQTEKYKGIIAVAVIGLVAIPSLKTDFLYFSSGYGNRDRLTEAVQHIQQKWHPNDQIFPLYFFPNSERAQDYLKTTAELIDFQITDEQILFPETPAELDQERRIWVVTIGKPLPPNSTGFYEWVSLRTNMVAEFKANKGPKDNTVRIYLQRPLKNDRGINKTAFDSSRHKTLDIREY